jgi:hypothetical protein
MAWVNWTFYKEEYRMNTDPAIPESGFAFWEKQARRKINRKHIVLDPVPEIMKECVCEVAEHLYKCDKANDPNAIKSYSNDGYSETYVTQCKSAKDEEIELREIITRHLSGTELHNDFLYSGV